MEDTDMGIYDKANENQRWKDYYAYLKMYGFFHTENGNNADNTIEDEAKKWSADVFRLEAIPFDKEVNAYSATLTTDGARYTAIITDNSTNRNYLGISPIAYIKKDRVIILSSDNNDYITNKEPQSLYNYSLSALEEVLSDKATHARSTWSDIKVSVGISSSPFKKIEPALTALYKLGKLDKPDNPHATAEYHNKIDAVINACQAYINYKKTDKREEDYNDSDKARLAYANDVIEFMKKKQNELDLVEKAVTTLECYSESERNPERLAERIAGEDAQLLKGKAAVQQEPEEQHINTSSLSSMNRNSHTINNKESNNGKSLQSITEELSSTFNKTYKNETPIPAIVADTFDTESKNLYNGLLANNNDIESNNLNAAYVLGSMIASELIKRENKFKPSDFADRGGMNYRYLSVYNNQDKDSENYKKSASYVRKDILKMGMSALKAVGSKLNLDITDNNINNFDNPLLSNDAITKIMDNFNAEQVTTVLMNNRLINKIYNERSLSHTMESYAFNASLQDKEKFNDTQALLYRFATKGIVEPLEQLEAQAENSNKKLDDIIIKKEDAQKLYAEYIFSSALLQEIDNNRYNFAENMKLPMTSQLTNILKEEGEAGLQDAHDRFIKELLSYSVKFKEELPDIKLNKDISVKGFKWIISHDKPFGYVKTSGVSRFNFTYKGIEINGTTHHDYKEALTVNGMLAVHGLLDSSEKNKTCDLYGEPLLKSFKKHSDDLFPKPGYVYELKRSPGATAAAKDIFASITAITLINYDQMLINNGNNPAFSSLAGQLDSEMIKNAILSTEAAKNFFKGAKNTTMVNFVSNENLRNNLAKDIQPQVASKIKSLLEKMQNSGKTTNKKVDNKTRNNTNDKTSTHVETKGHA